MSRTIPEVMADDRFSDLEEQWLKRIKQTMAIDLARGMSAGIPPAGLVEMLFRIPEVEQAMRMRAKGPPKDR
jgi:hypothetical protein